jgi:type I restriction enzyme S subunit
MTEWKECKLKELADFNPDSLTIKNSSKFINYLDTGNITKGKIDTIHYFNLLTDKVPSRAKRIVKKNDIVYSTVRPNQEHYGIIKNPVDNMVVSTGFAVLRTKEDKFYSDFLYYFLTLPENIEYLSNVAEDSTTAYPAITPDVIMDMDIFLPPLPEQKAIAEVLSSLDDKIDLLTRQNKTLEDLAQTYFRKWFVEDASEDWDVVPISSKYNILLGGTPSRKIESYWKNGTVGWINSGKVNDFRILEASEFITEEALQKSAAKLLPAGTTVIAITGATLGQISIIEYSFAANQSVIGLVPKAELSNNFIYLWLKENLDALVSRQTGGAQQHINSDDVKSFEVVVPNSKMVNLFSIVIDPMMEKISRNCFQILILQKLRDTLLPKLISGEVRVKQ